ncbi:MAG: serine/threonine protein kinase [Myxococcales bacterium]|nr:serine/threonine protein kinase [Myxococcales bacterium]MCB9520093.1 serine/threonine protein kinase [Myxococcales bacterium]MCB9531819.1 serine/threonine protein kinase [Myxococcales bacterium]
MQTLRPIIFGKHCLLERVSIGGMAEVYRARPFNAPGFKRFLALKRILPNLAADSEFISMFVDEAKIAVQLNHRAVCQIYELGRLEGSFYIVMEYIAGRDVLALQNWFRKRKKIMSVVQAAFIAAEVCEGLDYAHRKVSDDGQPLNIIHRDISPQNVLVSYEGEVKLIDFGIARAATTNQTTQVGVLKGKFGYMSPEQVDALPLDHRSDIFAVGTLLWEMLTARRLFYGDSDFATLEKVRSATIEPPSSRNANVPQEIDRIVLRALTRDRDERYAWASEMAADLRAFLATAAPDYGQERLGTWMCRNFATELETEREKTDLFARFVTVDDVHRHYKEHPEVDPSGARLDPGLDEDAEEATRVVEGSDGEVLAAGPAGALEARLESVESGLPAASGPAVSVFVDDDELNIVVDDPMADLAAPAPLTSPPLELPRRAERAPRSRLIAPLAVAFVVAVAVVGALAARRAATPTGVLTIDADPRDGTEVFLDGVRVEGPLPARIEHLSAAPRIVEIRHAGYEPIVEQVEVGERSVTEFHRRLVSAQTAQADLILHLPDAGAQVYLDGTLVGGQGDTRTLPVTAGTPHEIEVFRPGHFVETLSLQATPNARYERTVELRAVEGTVSVASDPPGTVLVDGVERGGPGGPVVVSGLDVRRPYRVEVRPPTPSFRPYTQTVVFDTYYDLRLRPRLARLGTTETEAPVPFGYITVAATDTWYRVFVDGRDTGLVTPIQPDAPLALKAGDRTVSFVRSGDRRDVRVHIDDAQTLAVRVPGT